MRPDSTRRDFLKRTLGAGAVLAAAPLAELAAADKPGSKMRLGLVTYLWAKDWDLPTLIANCEKSKVLGVELRTTHKHGVEIKLNAKQRAEVKKRFDDSPVVHVGIGSNERFDSPDPARLKQAIEARSKRLLRNLEPPNTPAWWLPVLALALGLLRMT